MLHMQRYRTFDFVRPILLFFYNLFILVVPLIIFLFIFQLSSLPFFPSLAHLFFTFSYKFLSFFFVSSQKFLNLFSYKFLNISSIFSSIFIHFFLNNHQHLNYCLFFFMFLYLIVFSCKDFIFEVSIFHFKQIFSSYLVFF